MTSLAKATRSTPAVAEIAAGVGVFGAALSTFILTAPRSVAGSDSAELATAAATLGIPHAPGYPLYVLVGRAFAAIPLGEVAFRLNLMSSLFGALAALAVYAVVLELTQHRLSAIVASLSLSFSHHFWGQSLVAEVYSMDAALVGGTLYCLCRWQRTRNSAALAGAFLLFGLSLAHRPTTLLLLPAIMALGVLDGPRYRGDWLRAIGWAGPGLALYLLLPVMYLAQPAYMWSIGYDPKRCPFVRGPREPGRPALVRVR